MPETNPLSRELLIERLLEPMFYEDDPPAGASRAVSLQWEAWKRGGLEGWARERLRQTCGGQEVVRRFLMQPAGEERKDDGPAVTLFREWLKGGRTALEAKYDEMYPQDNWRDQPKKLNVLRTDKANGARRPLSPTSPDGSATSSDPTTQPKPTTAG
jgi:hypothetical protein